MEKQKVIHLSSVEVTAYWWIRTIKEKVRELNIEGAYNKSETKFYEIFNRYTEREWRNLYLKLIPYITKEVSNYTKPIYEYETDTFHQDTDKKGHTKINNWISKIIGCSIPDIRLSSNSSKDLVTYTSIDTASVWYKSCSMRELSTDYEPSYIITGDEVTLDFYNLLISTVAVLNQLNKNFFNSVEILRNVFCEQYISASKKKKMEIYEMFNDNFDASCNKHIILGNSWKSTYICCIRDIDLIGLDKYMEQAQRLANLILQKNAEDVTSHDNKASRQKIKEI